jgi:hypothetical protein
VALCQHRGLGRAQCLAASQSGARTVSWCLIAKDEWLRQPRLEPKLFDPDLIFVAVEMIVIALGIVTAACLANPPNK